MEVDENTHNPESNFEGLVCQVEEQSELCDVIVRTRDWQKKFHRCVFSASLLFQRIINEEIGKSEEGNVATKPGILEVETNAPSEVVEMAIMFMYGQTPDFDIGNISDLLDLAEYLKIEELRHAGVDWLNTVDYSEVNCLNVIHLSGKYGFDIPSCITYIEGHLPKVFLLDESSELSAEAVEYFFTKDIFTYINMDDKFNFLIKWANKQPTETRKESVVQLFETLNLPEISSHIWENAKNDTAFNSMVHLDTIVRQTEQEHSETPVIMIASEENFIACLELLNDRWYRLNTKYYKMYPYSVEIAGVRNGHPEVYFKEDYILEGYLETVNLESDQICTYQVQMDLDIYQDREILDADVTHINFTNDTLIAIVEKTIQIYGDSDSSDSESENEKKENIISLTDVYIGHVSEEEVIDMQGHLSFRKERITQVCVNDQSVLALLTKSGGCLHVILYDLLQGKMERIFSVLEEKYELCATDNGFLLHNNTRCFCFTRLATPVYSGNYKIEKYMFENNEGWIVKYKYQCGIWMRILRRSPQSNIELQYLSHEELIVGYTSSLNAKWRNVSMPVDVDLFDKLEQFKNIFIVPLSKTILRCNILCPHCKFLSN